MTKLLVAIGVCVAVGVALAPIAAADPVSDAATALQSQSLYVGDPSAVISDQAGVEAALPTWMKIAVLPADAGSAVTLANQIGTDLDPNQSERIVVGVVVGHTFGAGSSAYCAGYAESRADLAVKNNKAALQAGGTNPDLTGLIKDFASLAATGPRAGSAACNGGSGGSGGATTATTTAASATDSNTHSTNLAPWFIGFFVVVAGFIGWGVMRSRRRTQRTLADARANVEPYYDRLANELNTLDPGDNDVARQAIADASERFTAAGAQLSAADSVQRFALARRTTLEGLYAARTARTALGLHEGPPLPPIYEGPEQQLSEPQTVTVRGQSFQGYPSYTPGAPYYYGGGYGAPGGWYATPFWETLLIGSVLTGGFGGGWGGWGGGGYNNGYGSGYDAGYQAGDNAGQNAAGDWGAGGNSGGGDWGGGGFGGGDFGGGGGDFGDGGGDSGGSW